MADERRVSIVVSVKDQATAPLKNATGGFGKLNSSVKDLIGVDLKATVSIAAVGMALQACVKNAMEAERVNAATSAAIAATGRSADITTKQVGDMSLKLSELTGIEDESVQKANNLLLVFKNIGVDALPRVSAAAADMAAAMSGGNIAAADMSGTAQMLGRALDNPIRGMTLLQRQGISFTEEEKKTIKSMTEHGQVAEAQGIILSKLEGKYKGFAETLGNTTTGKIEKANNAIGNLSETIGMKLLPAIGDAATYVAGFVKFTDTLIVGIDKLSRQTDSVDNAFVRWTVAIKNVNDLVVPLYPFLSKIAAINWDESTRAWEGIFATVGASGEKVVSSTSDMITAYASLRDASKTTSESIGADADAMAQADAEMAKSIQESQAVLAAGMQGLVDKEMTSFSDKQSELKDKANELYQKYVELSSVKLRTPEQAKELEETKTGMEELSAQYAQNAEDHELATKRILFGMLEQKVATLGLVGEQASAWNEYLMKLAENWGLVDTKSAEAFMAISSGVDAVAKSENWNMLDAILKRQQDSINGVGVKWAGANQAATAYAQAVAAIPDKTITITTHYQTVGSPTAYTPTYTPNSAVGPGAGRRQFGGPVSAGRSYVWNENQSTMPEVLVPSGNGYVLNRQQAQSALAGAVGGGGDTALLVAALQSLPKQLSISMRDALRKV